MTIVTVGTKNLEVQPLQICVASAFHAQLMYLMHKMCMRCVLNAYNAQYAKVIPLPTEGCPTF